MNLDWRDPVTLALLLLLPAAALYTWMAATLVGWLHAQRGVRTPYTRKIFHFAIFSAAVVVQYVFTVAGVMLFGGIVASAVVWATLRGDGDPFYEALARPSDAPHRTLFVLVPLLTTALGGLASNWLFGNFAMVGYLVAGWGDAIGEPVGTRWGRHRYRVPSLAGVRATRSIEGSAAVLLLGALAATLVLLVWGHDPLRALGVGLACGVAGALVEAVSSHGLDNLTVQLAAAASAAWLVG